MLNIIVLLAILANVKAGLYCPSENDFIASYGTPQFFNQGWTTHGSGAAATKASFNLIEGSVELDIDFSGVHPGVNANFYSISPTFSGSFKLTDYCDGGKTGNGWCVEADWVESNGNCAGQTTLHTRPGPGSDGCTAWGCANSYHYNGRASYHMAIYFDKDGKWTVVHDGQTIGPQNLNPTPQDYDWNMLKSQYQSRGAVLYSSQWVGWVPVADCGTTGDLASSTYTVKNLRINGTVVQGPTPKSC